MDIEIFTTGVRREVQWEEGKYFFDRGTILFHKFNNTNITYQQFHSCLHLYFTHS